MKPWRKVSSVALEPSMWVLRLECGHVAYRSAQYSRRELPDKALCTGCALLIGSQVKNPLGKFGTVAGYSNGLFDVTWNNNGSNRWTLDELRNKLEIV